MELCRRYSCPLSTTESATCCEWRKATPPIGQADQAVAFSPFLIKTLLTFILAVKNKSFTSRGSAAAWIQSDPHPEPRGRCLTLKARRGGLFPVG